MLGNLGYLNQIEGQMDTAESNFQDALQIHRKTKNRRFEGLVLSNLGSLYATRENWEEAQESFHSALHLLREIGDVHFEGYVLGELGIVEATSGQIEAGLAHMAQAEVLTRQVNDQVELGLLFCKRAHAEHLADHPDAAARSMMPDRSQKP